MTQHDLYVERQDPTPRMRSLNRRIERHESQASLSLLDYIDAADEVIFESKADSYVDFTVGSGWISWASPETPDQVQSRIENAKAGERKHLAAIKRMYQTYKEAGLYDE